MGPDSIERNWMGKDGTGQEATAGGGGCGNKKSKIPSFEIFKYLTKWIHLRQRTFLGAVKISTQFYMFSLEKANYLENIFSVVIISTRPARVTN